MAILQELLAEKIGKGVVFLIEGEDGGIRSALEKEVSLVAIGIRTGTHECQSSLRSSSRHRQGGRPQYCMIKVSHRRSKIEK